MKSKFETYLGFAVRAGKVARGSNKCLSLVTKRKVRLLILAEDLSENTIKKMTQKCRSSGTPYRIFQDVETLSRITGGSGNGVFAVTDDHFAKIITEEIDRDRSEGVCNVEKGI
ncbi:MAG: L7Ae/L30e/S12e/Gadd45 family ribosomal protein [Anaerovoracaceae bacterium]|jgi:ribosomal protein L7Ae-like RNA K-turn-binding protein